MTESLTSSNSKLTEEITVAKCSRFKDPHIFHYHLECWELAKKQTYSSKDIRNEVSIKLYIINSYDYIKREHKNLHFL